MVGLTFADIRQNVNHPEPRLATPLAGFQHAVGCRSRTSVRTRSDVRVTEGLSVVALKWRSGDVSRPLTSFDCIQQQSTAINSNE